MNEPLKPKLFSVYGQLLNMKILRRAWTKVKKNKGSGGVDKQTINDFDKDSEKYLSEILYELQTKTYKPSPVRRVYIKKKNGKLRPLGIPTIKDRVVQQALTMVLEPTFEEKVFHNNSVGFRPGKGVQNAINKVVYLLEREYYYVYDFDIKGFFDNIPHKKFMKVMNKYVSDGTVLDLIWKWLKRGYMKDSVVYETPKGTIQGGVISPLIANIYLNELDWELHKAGHLFVRYADDCIVFCKTQEELERAKVLVKEVLTKLGLELAEDKTDDIDFHKKDFEFLGFRFKHLRKNKDGEEFFRYTINKSTIKKFKQDIKLKTKKTYSKSLIAWAKELAPILRGKYGYMLTIYKTRDAMREQLKKEGIRMKGTPQVDFDALDGYVRRRIRMIIACQKKKHQRYANSILLNFKYPNTFFIEVMRLPMGEYLLANYYHENRFNIKLSITDYVTSIKEERKMENEKKNAKKKYLRKCAKEFEIKYKEFKNAHDKAKQMANTYAWHNQRYTYSY